MSISDIKKALGSSLCKTVGVYLIMSVICIAITLIYAIFAHGIRSDAMDFMLLYPLLGGALAYSLMGSICPQLVSRRFYRMGYNLYNAGIAVLTAGAMLQGIVEIAGSDSELILCFSTCGIALILIGIVAFIRR